MRVRRTPPQQICAGHRLARLAIPSESAITICLGILSRGNFLKGYARFTEVLDSRGEAATAGGGGDDDDDDRTPISTYLSWFM